MTSKERREKGMLFIADEKDWVEMKNARYLTQKLNTIDRRDFEEINLLARDHPLFIGVECPESFLQVVAFRGAEAVDVAVGAVVVCDEQALIGDDASCASELH